MSRMTNAQIRAGTITPDSLRRLFEVVTDERTVSLAIWYVTLHDADDKKLAEALEILKKTSKHNPPTGGHKERDL